MLAVSHEHSVPLAVTDITLSSGPKGITPVENVAWNLVSPMPVHQINQESLIFSENDSVWQDEIKEECK